MPQNSGFFSRLFGRRAAPTRYAFTTPDAIPPSTVESNDGTPDYVVPQERDPSKQKLYEVVKAVSADGVVDVVSADGVVDAFTGVTDEKRQKVPYGQTTIQRQGALKSVGYFPITLTPNQFISAIMQVITKKLPKDIDRAKVEECFVDAFINYCSTYAPDSITNNKLNGQKLSITSLNLSDICGEVKDSSKYIDKLEYQQSLALRKVINENVNIRTISTQIGRSEGR
jgi:hypothetical protein